MEDFTCLMMFIHEKKEIERIYGDISINKGDIINIKDKKYTIGSTTMKIEFSVMYKYIQLK